MYRALYKYESCTKNFDLSFEAGDQFTDLEKPEKGWLWVQNGFGEIGYIPASYVEREDNSTLAEILSSIDRAIQNIHYQAAASGTYSHSQRDNLHKLGLHRQHVLKDHGPYSASEHFTTDLDSSSDTSLHHSEHSSHSESSTPEKHHILPDFHLKKKHTHRPAPPPPEVPADQTPWVPDSHEPWPHHTTGEKTHSSQGSLKHRGSHSSQGSTKHSSPHSSSDSLKRKGQDRGHNPSRESLKHESSEGTPLISSGVGAVADTDWVHVDDTDGKPVSLDQDPPLKSDGGSSAAPSDSAMSTDNSNRLSVSENKMLKSESVISLSSRLSLSNSPVKQLDRPSVINLTTIPLPTNLATELVGEVRRHTKLSYDKSCLAVEVVLTHVANRMPQTAGLMEKILCTFQEVSTASEDDLSHDHVRIQELLEKITECKDDSQQRSWALHEDQPIIAGFLEELLSILENAKPSTCRHAIASDGYDCVHSLVQYYQMEVRLPLRLALLKVFGALCGLESSIIAHLLYSILPLELVSEILHHNQEPRRLSYVTLVLTMIFSTGEPIPSNLHESMSHEFLEKVLDMVENPASVEHDDQCTDALVNLLLAYNLHFPFQEANDIMSILAKKGTVKVFTEKLLEIFNKGEDPVKMFDHQTYPVQSQVKFMIDMFSQTGTASLLYVNDAKVLIDIIIRYLTDLQPGDKVRSSILILVKLLLQNSDYFDHQHRMTELCECAMSIMREEDAVTAQDRKEADIILKEINKHI